jgi:hypothetical protein
MPVKIPISQSVTFKMMFMNYLTITFLLNIDVKKE